MHPSKFHKRFIDLSRPLKQAVTDVSPKLSVLEDVKMIAYDFYGTLFISGVGDIGVDDGNFDPEIMQHVLESAGINITSEDAAAESFKVYNNVVDYIITTFKDEGMEYPEPDVRSIWQSVLSELKRKGAIQYQENSSIYEIVSIEFEARMNPVWPMPGVVDTLLFFKEKNVTQGIISNSQFYTPIVLEALTGYPLQDLGFSENLLHWSFEEGMKKPGLTFYSNFIKKLNHLDERVRPEQVLYLGNDMLKDVYPAREMGMRTALFAGDHRSLKWRKNDDRCKHLEPDLIITQLNQLKECIKFDD